MAAWPSGLGNRLQSGLRRFDSGRSLQEFCWRYRLDRVNSNPVRLKVLFKVGVIRVVLPDMSRFGEKQCIRSARLVGAAAAMVGALAFGPGLVPGAGAEAEMAPCAHSAGQPDCPAVTPETSVAIVSPNSIPDVLARADVDVDVVGDDSIGDNLTWPRLALLAVAAFAVVSYLAQKGAGRRSRDFGKLTREEREARESFNGPYLTSDGKPLDFDGPKSHRSTYVESTADAPHPYLSSDEVAADPSTWVEGEQSVPSVLHEEQAAPPPSWGSVGATRDSDREYPSRPTTGLLGELDIADPIPAAPSVGSETTALSEPSPPTPTPVMAKETPPLASPALVDPAAPVESIAPVEPTAAMPESNGDGAAPPSLLPPSVFEPVADDAPTGQVEAAAMPSSPSVPSAPSAPSDPSSAAADDGSQLLRPRANDDQMPDLLAELPFAPDAEDAGASVGGMEQGLGTEDDGNGWWSTFDQPHGGS